MSNWVQNKYGKMIHFATALTEMDEAICDEINFALGYCDPQEFFDEYCAMHKAKYGAEFELQVA